MITKIFKDNQIQFVAHGIFGKIFDEEMFRIFNTLDEARAYMLGVDDAEGYMDTKSTSTDAHIERYGAWFGAEILEKNLS